MSIKDGEVPRLNTRKGGTPPPRLGGEAITRMNDACESIVAKAANERRTHTRKRKRVTSRRAKRVWPSCLLRIKEFRRPLERGRGPQKRVVGVHLDPCIASTSCPPQISSVPPLQFFFVVLLAKVSSPPIGATTLGGLVVEMGKAVAGVA